MTKRNRKPKALQDDESGRTSAEHIANTDNGQPNSAAEARSEPSLTGADPLLAIVTNELEKLDRLSEPNIPNQMFFEQLVTQGKREVRRKLVRDLSLFWLIAVSILIVYGAVAIGRPLLFIAIQFAAAAVVPIVVLMSLRRKRVTDRT